MKEELIRAAENVTGLFELDSYGRNAAGSVGAALMTADGNIYTGICLDMVCGIGFCAEASAVAEMLKHRESEIAMIVAVNRRGNILPPCGRCRELLFQVNAKNLDTAVLISRMHSKTLRELLPDLWVDSVTKEN